MCEQLHCIHPERSPRHTSAQETLTGVTPAYVEQALTPLQSQGVLDLSDGECNLSQDVTALLTPGHTPGSLSLLVASRGERAMIVRDAIGHPAQVEHPDWSIIHDSDGPQTELTRRFWQPLL